VSALPPVTAAAIADHGGSYGPILLQKSFCTGGRKFCGPPMRFSSKDVGGLISSR
jgi:hypothetical protein